MSTNFNVELWDKFDFEIDGITYNVQTKRNQEIIFELYIRAKRHEFGYFNFNDLLFDESKYQDQTTEYNKIIKTICNEIRRRIE